MSDQSQPTAQVRQVSLSVAKDAHRNFQPRLGQVKIGVKPPNQITKAFAEHAVVGFDVLLSPIVSGPIIVTNGGGSLRSAPRVVLIFWGTAWTNPSTSPSANDIISSVKSVLSGPYMSALRQYGIKRGSFLESIILTGPEAPASFSDVDVQLQVFLLVDGSIVDGSNNQDVYVVFMPPGSTYSPGGARGAHSTAWLGLSGFSNKWAVLAWIGNDSLDVMMSAFTHELAEMCTDPGGDTWTVKNQPASLNEIGDVCNAVDAKLNRINVESYWSVTDNACIVPTAYSVRRALTWAKKKLNGKGIRSLKSPIPSLNSFIVNL
jgi:hypothetical protein